MFIISVLWFVISYRFCGVKAAAVPEDVYTGSEYDLAHQLLLPQTVVLSISTSSSTYAETSDPVQCTFYGDLAASGPHVLGPFPDRGDTVRRQVLLDKYIGTFNYIDCENLGHDGWLPSKIYVEVNGVQYHLAVPEIWLDSFDLALFKSDGNGFEPRVQRTSGYPADASHATHLKYVPRTSIKMNVITGNPLKYYQT